MRQEVLNQFRKETDAFSSEPSYQQYLDKLKTELK